MKKRFILTLLSINLLFFAFNVYLLIQKKDVFFKNREKISNVTSVQEGNKKYNIAIFTPTTHPSLINIENGFKKILNNEKESEFSFVIYNANGNRILMRSQAEEIINNNFDLIFSIGVGCTQIIKELSVKKQKNVPIVFGDVSRPEKLNLVKSLKSSGNNLTGITLSVTYEQQLDLLKALKPNTKTVLLVYNPTEGAGLAADKKVIEELLNKKEITLKTIEVFNSNEIQGKISSSLNNVDVVLVLKDNTVVSAVDSLVKLCNRHNVTLLTTDLDSGQKGAAISFGVKESDFGKESAKKALLILKNQKSPSSIPITYLNDYKLIINTQTMEQQGLYLDKNVLFLIKSGQTI